MDFWLLVPHVEVTTVLMTSKKLNGLKKKKKTTFQPIRDTEQTATLLPPYGRDR